MQRHFSQVASAYRGVRTTDTEPVLFIKEKIGDRDRLRAGDIGCGAGRYDRLILEHLPLSGLICIDANPHMLREAKNHLNGASSAHTHFLTSRSENLPLRNNTFDCLFTFNAVHHFDLGGFLHQIGAALKKSSCLFIYTRLPDQNEASIWGKHFPGFNEKETRLMAWRT
jgi:ubiquinone/menaquinone biosynthesis C-methylase UbiE